MTFEGARTALGTGTRAIALTALAFGATALYFAYLSYQNERAADFVGRLEAEDPTRYLDELRRLEGFDSFLAAFRDIEGFTEFAPQAPPFLTGRWTMKEERIRVPPNSSFALCPHPLMIDYGRITLGNGQGMTSEAQYRLTSGGELEVQTDRFGRIEVEIVAYGPQINFLEFTPPGADDPVHAYRCTM